MFNIKEVQTYQAIISLGFKEHYSEKCHNLEEVIEICQEYCDNIGLCVTVTPTNFIYTNGGENGCLIGLINYPRFPSTPEEIFNKAFNLAGILKEKFNQFKVSIICSDKTVMLE